MRARALPALLLAAAAAAATVNVMPLGDSITFGCGSDATPPGWYATCTPTAGGYRAWLWGNASAAGLDVAMVGSQSEGPAWVPEPQRRHEGHPGWRIGQVTAYAATWLAQRADVYLIHLGTNDVGQNRSLANMTSDVAALLEVIRTRGSARLPGGPRVFVATILAMVNPAHPGWVPAVGAFNAALPGVVAAAAARGLNVTLVDMHAESGMCSANLTATDCCLGNSAGSPGPDRVHPTGWGYSRMAAVWWRHVGPALAWFAAARGGA